MSDHSNVFFNREHDIHIREYYMYCVDLFLKFIKNKKLNYNIIFGNYEYNFNNKNQILKIDIQPEHTLVINGGRSINQLIYGGVNYKNNNYLIRIQNFDYLKNLDFIIEYSLSNIENIKTNKYFNDYLKKNIHIFPCLYDINFISQKRNDVLFLFDPKNNLRRKNILNICDDNNLKYKNVFNIFDKSDLFSVYQNTKIMVNIHQTDHHHTFEELRILPALMSGVVIISEDVPLKETIPYHEYIIWADYSNIYEVIKYVNENYVKIYDKIFNSGNLRKILLEMLEYNKNCYKKI